MTDANTRLCARCLQTIAEGRGEFFEVQITAVADPSPPILDEEIAPHAFAEIERRRELEELLEDVSAQEAQDQIHRQVTLSLCNRCFGDWIEDPAGK